MTTEKLKKYYSYGVNIDRLARVERNHEKKLFDNYDWSIISSIFQDIELIKKGLAAQTDIDQTIDKLKLKCDNDSFDKLMTYYTNGQT